MTQEPAGAPPPRLGVAFEGDRATLPQDVVALAGTSGVTPLWRNPEGGVTVRLDDDAGARVLKWSPFGSDVALDDERARLEWASAWHSVPRVLAGGVAGEGDWLLLEFVDGLSAVSKRWRTEPRTAVRALGEGLRRLHEALPVAECPWLAGLDGPGDADVLVVAHGDACAPNTLLDAHGAFLAHVDLGQLGVADRWLDLAVGSMSLDWNFGPGWQAEYFAAYGVQADHGRIAEWRAWWHRGDGDAS